MNWIGVGTKIFAFNFVEKKWGKKKRSCEKNCGLDWIWVGSKKFAFNWNRLDLSGVEKKMSEQKVGVEKKILWKNCGLDWIGVGVV